MSELKLCVDCKWSIPPKKEDFRGREEEWYCFRTVSRVTGKRIPEMCVKYRNDEEYCGPDGEWFEPKQK